MATLKQKVKKYIILNTIFHPIAALFGLVSSIFVVRLLGVELYGMVVVLTGFMASIDVVLSLGFESTVIKLWTDFDDPKQKEGLIAFCILLQIIIIFSIFMLYIVYPAIPEKLLGRDFIEMLPSWGIIGIIISVILSKVFTSRLNAELENRITLGSSLSKLFMWSTWLICASVMRVSPIVLMSGLLIVQFISVAILVIGSYGGLSLAFFKHLKYVLNLSFYKKFFPFFTMISMVTLFRYIVGLPFIALVLNKHGMVKELVCLSIILKIISVIQNIINIPTNKVVPVLYANAFKKKNDELLSKTYSFIQRYNMVMFIFSYAFLCHFVEGFVSDIYGIELKGYYFDIFFFITMVSVIFGVTNSLAQMYEHYFVTIGSCLLAYVVTMFIYSNYIGKYGLMAVFAANLLNYLLRGGVSQIYMHKKYPILHFPWRMLISLSSALIVSVFVSYFIGNYIASSIACFMIFVLLVWVVYRPDNDDRYLLNEILPVKVYDSVSRHIRFKT